jgi:hypothetical protein
VLRGIAFLGIIGLLCVQAFVCVLAVTHSPFLRTGLGGIGRTT